MQFVQVWQSDLPKEVKGAEVNEIMGGAVESAAPNGDPVRERRTIVSEDSVENGEMGTKKWREHHKVLLELQNACVGVCCLEVGPDPVAIVFFIDFW